MRPRLKENRSMTQKLLNRRSLLKSASGMIATAAAVRALLPAGAWASTPTPEVTGAKLGYIALTDSAPLIIALEKGFFAAHGMPDMLIEKQASWGATRDNMALGKDDRFQRSLNKLLGPIRIRISVFNRRCR